MANTNQGQEKKKIDGYEVAGKASNLLGLSGSGVGMAGAFVNDEKSPEVAGKLSIASGGLSALGGGIDIVTGIHEKNQIGKKNENGKYVDEQGNELPAEEQKKLSAKKRSANVGILSSTFGALGGLADVAGGIGTLFGSKSTKKWAGGISGLFGVLGGISGVAKGFMDRKAIKSEIAEKEKALQMKEDELSSATEETEKERLQQEKEQLEAELKDLRKQKGEAWNNIIGSGLSGLGGLLGGLGSIFGSDKTEQAGSIIGSGSGILSSGASLFGIDGFLGGLFGGKSNRNASKNQDNSPAENQDKSNTEDQNDSPAENQDKSNTEDQNDSPTENQDKSNTEDQNDSPTESQDKSNTEDQNDSPTENTDESLEKALDKIEEKKETA